MENGIGISRSALDRLVRENKIPYVKIGNKVMVNYDKLLEFLNNGTVTGEIAIDDYSGTIRKGENMSNKDFLTVFHSLTSEKQLEFMCYVKGFKDGKDLYEIMTCDTLPKWLA